MPGVHFTVYGLDTVILDESQFYNPFQLFPILLFQSHSDKPFGIITARQQTIDEAHSMPLEQAVASLAKMGIVPSMHCLQDDDTLDDRQALDDDYRAQLAAGKINEDEYEQVTRLKLGGMNFQLNRLLVALGATFPDLSYERVLLVDGVENNTRASAAMTAVVDADGLAQLVGTQSLLVRKEDAAYLDKLAEESGLAEFATAYLAGEISDDATEPMQRLAAVLYYLYKQPERVSEIDLLKLLSQLNENQSQQVLTLLNFQDQPGQSFLTLSHTKAIASVMETILKQKVQIQAQAQFASNANNFLAFYGNPGLSQQIQGFIKQRVIALTRAEFEETYKAIPALPIYQARHYPSELGVEVNGIDLAPKMSLGEIEAGSVLQGLFGKYTAQASRYTQDELTAIALEEEVIQQGLHGKYADDAYYKENPSALKDSEADCLHRNERESLKELKDDGKRERFVSKAVMKDPRFTRWDFSSFAGDQVLLSAAPFVSDATTRKDASYRPVELYRSLIEEVPSEQWKGLRAIVFGSSVPYLNHQTMKVDLFPFFEASNTIGELSCETTSSSRFSAEPDAKRYQLTLKQVKRTKRNRTVDLDLVHINCQDDAAIDLSEQKLHDYILESLESGQRLILQDSEGKGHAAVVTLAVMLYRDPAIFVESRDDVNCAIFNKLDELRDLRPGAIKNADQLLSAVRLCQQLLARKAELTLQSTQQIENTPVAIMLKEAKTYEADQPMIAGQFYRMLLKAESANVFTAAADFYLRCYKGQLDMRVKNLLQVCYQMAYLTDTAENDADALTLFRGQLDELKARQSMSRGEVEHRVLVDDDFGIMQALYKNWVMAVSEANDCNGLLRYARSLLCVYDAGMVPETSQPVFLKSLFSTCQMVISASKTLGMNQDIRAVLSQLHRTLDLQPGLAGVGAEFDKLTDSIDNFPRLLEEISRPKKIPVPDPRELTAPASRFFPPKPVKSYLGEMKRFNDAKVAGFNQAMASRGPDF